MTNIKQKRGTLLRCPVFTSKRIYGGGELELSLDGIACVLELDSLWLVVLLELQDEVLCEDSDMELEDDDILVLEELELDEELLLDELEELLLDELEELEDEE